MGEPGGADAADAMRDLVLRKELRCDLTGDRRYVASRRDGDRRLTE